MLFAATLVTTTAVGGSLAYNFRHDLPAIDLDRSLGSLAHWRELSFWLDGLSFSLTLLTILLAHELGHYFVCLYYRLDASPPYFLPSPTLIGTFGAFIRIRSPIYSRRVLFDVAVAGPIAGFVFLLPALTIGLAYSRVAPGIALRGDVVFDTPPILRLFESLIFPGVPSEDISLHPMARAAWVGVFATALNLLPIGQLDGGHLLYAFVGERHRLLSRLFLAALIPLGFFYWPWLLWAAILFFFGLRHPVIYDTSELGAARKKLGLVALAIFALCFMVAPIQTPD
ncbi:MAG: site-2 protease family protein [Bryobacterales bacterium]|nr:site-2 protease family protein [Bryobacteraceae bacterium]MDW8354313.1 site-2 protease family protein [Bryobacterales bacterium]